MSTNTPTTPATPPRVVPLRRNLTLSLLDGLFAMPISYLILPGNFIVAALLVENFHLHPAIYGFIVALPFIFNFLQVFAMPLLSRIASPKTLAVTASSTLAVFWGTLGFILPLIPQDNPRAAGLAFVIFFIISSAISPVAAVSWISWVQEWVPKKLRGKFFGRRNRFTQVSQLAIVFFTGFLLNKLNGALIAFQILLVASMLLRIVSIICLQKTYPRPPKPKQTEGRTHWREQLQVLRHTPAYIWFVIYGMAWGFAANCSGAFYPVFIYKIMNLTTQDLSFFVILSTIGGALSFPAWGALSDRFGNKPVMILCMILWQLQNYAWCFLYPGHNWPLYLMWSFGGIVAGGFTVSFFNIQLKVIPPAAKTLAVSINLALTSLVTALAPILSGAFLEFFLNGQLRHDTNVYHLFFLSTPTLGLLACLILKKVDEPAAARVAIVVGAMRNVRTLSSIVGAGFLVDYIFVRRPAQKKPAKHHR